MKNHNDPEAVEARKNQADPIIMYLIVRESLNMGVGKIAAQCGHAVQILQMKYYSELWKHWDSTTKKIDLYQDWLDSSFRKVVLKADDKEWKKLKEEFFYEELKALVVDAGLTEIAPGSETVIGLWPMYKSNVPKLIKKLQVLK